MAATTRLAASSGGTRNRAGAKIAELSNLLSDSLTSLLDIGQRMRHGGGPPVLAYHIRKEYRSKKETPLHLTSVSRTRRVPGKALWEEAMVNLGWWASSPSVSHTQGISVQKGNPATSHFCVAHPPSARQSPLGRGHGKLMLVSFGAGSV